MKKFLINFSIMILLLCALFVLSGCGSKEILENDTKIESNSASSKNDVEENNITNTDNNINRVYNEAEDIRQKTNEATKRDLEELEKTEEELEGELDRTIENALNKKNERSR